MLVALSACTGAPRVETVPSEHGPDMVRVPGAVVRLGRKFTPPVPGFGGGMPGGAPPSGVPGNGVPASGGAAPNGGTFGPPPNADGTFGNGGGNPTGAPALLPAPTATHGAPDLGLAPGAVATAGRPLPDPLDPRSVDVSPFLIDRTEVTQAHYADFLAATGYRPPYVDEPWAAEGWSWDGATAPRATADHPVVLVNWFDARAYCDWADKRLPTEAEWQLAVLGPADSERGYPWGDAYDGARLNHGTIDPPNYDDSDGYARTSPVGSFPAGASRYGLLDGFGNAWEWTADVRVHSWDDVLGARVGDHIVDPHTSEVGLYAAVRGGAYFFDLRPNPAGERSGFVMELRRKSSGFRCARDG
ncbi:MAG: SUMF1/EgtB/PvdO family nonheme iron enzyme [Myxococcota bacterium]